MVGTKFKLKWPSVTDVVLFFSRIPGIDTHLYRPFLALKVQSHFDKVTDKKKSLLSTDEAPFTQMSLSSQQCKSVWQKLNPLQNLPNHVDSYWAIKTHVCD